MGNEYYVPTWQEIEKNIVEKPSLQALKDEIFEHQLSISRLRDIIYEYYFTDRMYADEYDAYQKIQRRNKERLDALGFGSEQGGD